MTASPTETAPTPASSRGERKTADVIPMLVDTSTAAEILAISERKLWELTNCDAVPSVRIGKSVRYAVYELDDWVRQGCPTEPGSADLLPSRRQPRTIGKTHAPHLTPAGKNGPRA